MTDARNIQPSDSERASIFPLLVITLPVLLLMIGIALDVGMASVSLQQTRGYVRLMSLAAIEAYLRSAEDVSATPGQRLERTLRKVNSLARQNTVIGNYGAEALPLSYRNSYQESAGGLLLPGRYYERLVPRRFCPDGTCEASCTMSGEVETCNPCTTSRATASMPPCFYELSYDEVTHPDSALRKEPFAFMIKARLFNGIFARFARILVGDVEFGLASRSIATVTPRRMLFAVDVTGSMERQTYRRRAVSSQAETPAHGRGSKYAFFLTRDNHPNVCTGSLFPSTAIMSDDMQWRFLEDFNPALYSPSDPMSGYVNATPRCSNPVGSPDGVSRSASSLAPNAALHYYDDYQVVDVVTDPANLGALSMIIKPERHPEPSSSCVIDGSGSYCAPAERYRVDTCCEDPACGLNQPWCEGPQPLNAAINGLHAAVVALEQRLVPGDKLGFIFFDRSQVWTRIVKPTDDFEYLRMLTSRTPEGAAARYALKIFPGRESFTDLRTALAESMAQLDESRTEDQGLQTQDGIVLITDGLSNCTGCQGMSIAQLARYDINRDGMINANDFFAVLNCYFSGSTSSPECSGGPYTIDDVFNLISLMGCTYGCQNNYTFYSRSIAEVRALAQQMGRPGSNVPIHVVAVGESSGAHLVDRADPARPGQCLTDAEARTLRIPLVRGGVQDLTTGVNVPDCDSSANNAMACFERYPFISQSVPFYESAENLYYVARATGGTFAPIFLAPSDPSCGTWDCATNPQSPNCCRPDYVWHTDKYCRSPNDQIRDSISQIISEQAPFVIVDAD